MHPLDFLIIPLKYKKRIAGFTFVCTATMAILSLFMTPVFRAQAKILPSQRQSLGLASMFMDRMGGLGSLAEEMGGTKTIGPLYVQMLQSRPVVDAIIDKFDLMRRYDTKFRSEARKTLIEMANISEDKKSGVITITIDDHDPKRAADMANAFVNQLKELHRELGLKEAKRTRLFFEGQLKASNDSLYQAEEGMKEFQEKSGTINMEGQVQATLAAIAETNQAIATVTVKLRMLKSYAAPGNPEVQVLEQNLRGLQDQLDSLMKKGEAKKGGIIIPTSSIPSAGAEYFRKIREFKYNEELNRSLLMQTEMAILSEANADSAMRVLEEAMPPDRRIKPVRTFMVLVAMVVSFVFSVIAAFFVEKLKAMSDVPETRERLQFLKKNWLWTR